MRGHVDGIASILAYPAYDVGYAYAGHGQPAQYDHRDGGGACATHRANVAMTSAHAGPS